MKKSTSRTHNPNAFGVFFLAIQPFGAMAVNAVEAGPSPLVVGHKPIAGNVAIDKLAPTLGEALNVTYDFADVDDDAEGIPIIQWIYNGTPVAGEVGASYTPELNVNTGAGNACTDIQVVAEVTPQSQTGDPLVGDVKQSDPVALKLPLIPGFTFPKTSRLNWVDANNFCKAKGMQLPTRVQLQDVFNTYTSGGMNSQMAEKYGWPIIGKCGGDSNNYWTSEPSTSGLHWVVGMNSGGDGNSNNMNINHVTCVLGPGLGPAQLPIMVTLTHPTTSSATLNGPNFAGRPVVTVDEITANLTFVADTVTGMANYRFEWFAGGVTTGVVNDGNNKFTPRVQDQGKPIKVRVTLVP